MPQVLHLFIKTPSRVVLPCSPMQMTAGYGIEGDANAAVGSPRQVLVVGTAALTQFGLQPGDLRENLVLDGDTEAFTSGQVLQIGDRARIRLTFRCEPCASLERLQPGLARRITGKRGFLGMVVQAGMIQVGDTIQVTKGQFPALSDRARDRFREFVARIPPGRVVHTSDLLLATGCAPAYYRTIPAFLKTASPDLPVHRIVTVAGQPMLQHLPDQADRLRAEGVEIHAEGVDDRHRWHACQFHPISCL